MKVRLSAGKQGVTVIVASVVPKNLILIFNVVLCVKVMMSLLFLDFLLSFLDDVNDMPFFVENIESIFGINESVVLEIVNGGFVRELELQENGLDGNEKEWE